MTGSTTNDSNLLLKRISQLYCNESLSDMIFLIGKEKTRVPGHKFLLSIFSPEFANAFRNVKLDKDDLWIEDVTLETFQCFLKYFYECKVELDVKIAADVLKLSIRFGIEELSKICEVFLQNYLTKDSCLEFYIKMPFLNHNSQLRKEIFKIIGRNFDFLVSNNVSLTIFKNLTWNQLKDIVELEGLCCNEFKLFNGLMKWAKHNCQKLGIVCTSQNIRFVLGDIFSEIHFPSINKVEILEIFAIYPKLLTQNEICDIYLSSKSNVKPLSRKRYYTLHLEYDIHLILDTFFKTSENNLIPCFKKELLVCGYTEEMSIEFICWHSSMLNGFAFLGEKDQDLYVTSCTLYEKTMEKYETVQEIKNSEIMYLKLNCDYNLYIVTFPVKHLMKEFQTNILYCKVSSKVPSVKVDTVSSTYANGRGIIFEGSRYGNIISCLILSSISQKID